MRVWGVLRDAVLAEELAGHIVSAPATNGRNKASPTGPGVGLIAVAKRRAVDFFRYEDGRLLNGGNQIGA